MMKKLLLSILLIVTLNSMAQTTLMENFNYSAGQLTTLNAGTSVSGGTWINFSGTANPILVSTGGLTYTGYFGSNIGQKASLIATSSSAEDAYRSFGTTIYTTGEVLATFMINVTDTSRLLDNTSTVGDYFVSFLPSTSTTALNDRLSVRKGSTGNTFNIGVRTSSGMAAAVWAPTNYTPGVTYLIVLKHVTISGTSNDSTYLWINPTLSGIVPTADIATAQSGTAADLGDVARFALRQGTNTPNVSVDGIRVATTWVNSVLPVSLSGFKGENHGGKNILLWSTASEQNNKGFEVQKSMDGISFETIGFVNGTGNSNKTINYTFVDENISGTTNYYRLYQLDKDGEGEYSEIISVSSEDLIINVTPNPFNDMVVVESPVANQNVTAQILDMNGRMKTEMTGMGSVSLDTRELAEGVYFIRVNNGLQTVVSRIIKH